MLNKINFENYNDYLLSLNIAQISREFGFKKVGINSLYLITHLTRAFIEKIAVDTKKSTEASNRTESNLIDLLFTLSDSQTTQETMMKYIKESKIKYDFAKGSYIRKIYLNEERERNNHIRKINSSQITEDINMDNKLLSAIPKQLRYFPKEFFNEGNEVLINKQNNIISIPNILDEKKIRKDSVIHERKATEEVNIQTNYFDMSKKHTKKKISIDMSRILNEIIVENNEIHLGKKLKREDKNELSYLSASNFPPASSNK